MAMANPSRGGEGGAGNEVFSEARASSPSSSLSAVWLAELPHDCLIRIFSALSAPDVCRMARVCRFLRRIADSDEVWTSRLPSDPAIDPPSFPRKDLYFRLRAGMIHKDLSQPYWLDPETGEGVFVQSARDFYIEWGNDTKYWKWQHQAGSWFAESACLLRVCWFEVRGDFEGMFMPGAYTVSFQLSFLSNLIGWSGTPIKLSLSTSNGDHIESQRFLYEDVDSFAPLRSLRSSSWMELDIGEFVVFREMNVKLNFLMMEIVGGHWKQGLVLDCVKIRPTKTISRDAQSSSKHVEEYIPNRRMYTTHVD